MGVLEQGKVSWRVEVGNVLFKMQGDGRTVEHANPGEGRNTSLVVPRDVPLLPTHRVPNDGVRLAAA